VLHRRVGEVLQTLQPNALAELARHFRAGGDDERAIHYSREAGLHAARQGAYADAAAHLRTAVSLLDESSDLARKAELLRLLGGQLERLSRDEALEAYEQPCSEPHASQPQWRPNSSRTTCLGSGPGRSAFGTYLSRVHRR
jgi:uncharacterized protein HemY